MDSSGPWPEVGSSGVQHFEVFEKSLDTLFLRDGQRFCPAFLGCTNVEADFTHGLHGRAVLKCFLELSHHFLVVLPSDEDVVDVKAEACEGVVLCHVCRQTGLTTTA